MTSRSTTIPFSNLPELCRDRLQQSCEIFTPNDFYGHALAFKNYCGFPDSYVLKAVLEHGCALGGKIWEDCIKTPLPGLIAFSPSRRPFLEKAKDKIIECIGPYIHYAPHALEERELKRERDRLGQSLLVFPVHSSTHITLQYDIEDLCQKAKSIAKDFDTSRVCLYWRDFQLGRHLHYERHGFKCVSAGHIYDPLFLPRLKSIIASASLTMSNGVGTVMGYSVYMGIPHYFHDCAIIPTADTEEILVREYTPWHEKELSPDCLEVQSAFSTLDESITPRQQSVVKKYWGTDCIRPPLELRELFERLEEEYLRRNKMAC